MLRKFTFIDKALLSNITYLGLLQLVNIVLPLLTYPYLISTLGDSLYGELVYVQSIVAFLVLFVGFGLGLQGSIKVSLNRHDKEKIGETLSTIYIIKTVFIIVAFVILSLIIDLNPDYRRLKLLFYLSMWMCFYDAYFPGWYFQGIEQMKWITILSVLTRTIFTFGIFLIINSPEDYLLYPIAHGIGALATIIISFYIIHFKHNIPLKYVSKSQIINTLKESSPVFTSNLAINSSSSLTKILVGNSLGFADVSVYDLGEKILTILRTPLSILSQVLLPKVSKIKDPVNSMGIRNVMFIIGLIISLLGIGFSEWLVSFLGSGEMDRAWKYVIVFICYIPFLSLHSFYGVLFLIPYGRQNVFMRITLLIGVLTAVVYYTMHILYCSLFYYVLGGLMIEIFSVLLLHFQALKLITVKK